MSKTILLIDANNVAYRGYFRLKNITNGLELGFFNTLLRLARTYRTMEIKLAWDGELLWKHKLDPTYKKKVFSSEKEEQEAVEIGVRIACLREICRSFCDTFYHPFLEADEVAGILSCGCSRYDQNMVLFSGDGDWLQLIGNLIRVIRPGRYTDEFYDEERVIQEEELYPHNLAWFKALAGCASDKVRGVPRIRRDYLKKAIRGTNATFYDDWGKLLVFFRENYPKWYPKIEELEERILINYRLVNLRDLRYPCSASLAKGGVQPVIDFCKDLKLSSLLDRGEWQLFKPTGKIEGFLLKVVQGTDSVSKIIGQMK